ncbi:MAG: branched-chain amino acid ABC transporter permease [Thaumarchaeota archaeon]|nr:branched-chain amino acid ABC transporter permease [Nitrososphaerota archaeon]
MLDPSIVAAIIYGSIFGIMSMGLTVTYLTTKVPNFAYGSIVTVGIYTSFTLTLLNKLNPYMSIPFAFVFGGLASVAVYLLVLKPLTKRGSSLVTLMIATLAVDTVFVGLINIYADYLTFRYRLIDDKLFVSLQGDFKLLGEPGLMYTAPAALAITTVGIYLLLTRTKFGISTRAAVENANLARTVGINVSRVYTVSWFIAGGLAGMSGPFYAIDLGGSTDSGSLLIVEIFSASVLGGLSSVYGAMIGGLLVGLTEILVAVVGGHVLGSWFFAYQKGIPLVIMIVTLLILPQGIVSLDWRRLLRWRRKQ